MSVSEIRVKRIRVNQGLGSLVKTGVKLKILQVWDVHVPCYVILELAKCLNGWFQTGNIQKFALNV